MPADDVVSSLGTTLSKRSRSLLLLLDADLQVVLGEDEAINLLVPDVLVDAKGQVQLATRLRTLIKERTKAINGKSNATIGHGHLILRLVPMKGSLGKFLALTVEPLQTREDLTSQRKHYRLTARELDVLRLILQGLTAHEIAQVLNITKNTVTDYFKALLHKTSAKNRSEMIAKILNYVSHESPRRAL